MAATERPGQYAALPRELWREVMDALTNPNPYTRRRAYADLMRIAPPDWDTDLETEELC